MLAKSFCTFKVGITLFTISQPHIRFRGRFIIMNRVFVSTQRRHGLETSLAVVASVATVACVNFLVPPQLLCSRKPGSAFVTFLVALSCVSGKVSLNLIFRAAGQCPATDGASVTGNFAHFPLSKSLILVKYIECLYYGKYNRNIFRIKHFIS